MTDKRQSDALHLADIADDGAWTFVIEVRKEIAAELRRQYAEIETLRTGYEAARLEIESLKAQQPGAAIQRYKIGYHADEWGQRSSTPSGIPDASGSWVRYADHVTALAAGQATAALAAAPTANPAPQQDVSAAGGDSFLLLPTRPTPDAPANTAGLSWNAYSGAQMLAYGRSCSDAALVVAAHQPSPAARGDALDTMRLDWLDADASKCVFHLGKSWHTRPSYGLPYRKRASLREAIDAARAAQEGR